MPREGLKPGAVVEEGGKRAGETAPESGERVGLGVGAAPARGDPQAPPVPALSWQSGPGRIPWQPRGEGLRRRLCGPVSSANPSWPQLGLSGSLPCSQLRTLGPRLLWTPGTLAL